MATMDKFREIHGDGSVIVSIKKEHIDKVIKAIGDVLPDRMTEFYGGFVLLWEDIYFEHGLSEWYTNLVDLLESIDKEYISSQFSIETATWNSWDELNIEFNFHGSLGGFEPLLEYDLRGAEVDPMDFAKEE